MKSSNTTNDLIHFKSKKQELEKLHKREDYLKEKMHSNKASDNSHKVLQYPNKRKKTVKKLITLKEHFKSKLGKVGKFLKIIIYFLIFIILFLTIDTFLLSKNQKTLSSGGSTNFISESTSIPISKESAYSKIIDQSIKKYTGVSYKVKSNNMHKNGNRVYATGYFNDPSEGKIYFDIVLQNNNPESLVINGTEYVK